LLLRSESFVPDEKLHGWLLAEQLGERKIGAEAASVSFFIWRGMAGVVAGDAVPRVGRWPERFAARAMGR
jgi:hypothetical protein